LILGGQDPELAILAEEYVHNLIFGLPPFVAFHALTKYLQCQHILSPLIIIGVFANVLNFCLNYVFIYEMNLELKGAALATSLSRWSQLFLLCVYLAFSTRHRYLWPTLSWVPLQSNRLLSFLALGLYGGVMVGLECWAFTITIFLAGYLGALPLAAHSTTQGITSLAYMWVVFPSSIAISIRIGNLLGANEPIKAKRCAQVSLGIMTSAMLVIAVNTPEPTHQLLAIMRYDFSFTTYPYLRGLRFQCPCQFSFFFFD
jgi:MATE family multidrug resistance protein